MKIELLSRFRIRILISTGTLHYHQHPFSLFPKFIEKRLLKLKGIVQDILGVGYGIDEKTGKMYTTFLTYNNFTINYPNKYHKNK